MRSGWGPGYWWQNTRLPYLSMCTAGDYDLMQSFFRMYADDIYDLSRFRTKKYFGFDGAYFPECMYFWGSVFTASYGWTPFEALHSITRRLECQIRNGE